MDPMRRTDAGRIGTVQGVTAWQTRLTTKESTKFGRIWIPRWSRGCSQTTPSRPEWKQCSKSARGVYRINSPCHVRYADGCTHRKCGWSSCSIGVVVSSMRLRTRNSRSVVRASARVQCRTSWILRTPSACRPCSVSTGQDARAHHREVAPAPATFAKYTMPRNTSSGLIIFVPSRQ